MLYEGGMEELRRSDKISEGCCTRGVGVEGVTWAGRKEGGEGA